MKQATDVVLSESNIQIALQRNGYRIVKETFVTGRPDQATFPLVHDSGIPVVAKIYPAGKGERVYQNMLTVWNSCFGRQRQPPGLPRPIEFLAEEGILIMERVDGQPLSELHTEHPREQIIWLLADLHDSRAVASCIRGSKQLIRSLKRKADFIQHAAPNLHSLYLEVIEMMQTVRFKDELVSSHGDFSPRNILICSDRIVLIDWDRFQQSDRARDVAYYGVWNWAAALRNGRRPDWSPLWNFVQLYEQRKQATLRSDRLLFHITAGLLRVAHSIVKIWPHEMQFVPALIQEARHQMTDEARR